VKLLERLRQSHHQPQPVQPYVSALQWIYRNSKDGVCVSNKNHTEYPEVTGYLISTLLDWGEHDLARHYAAWLCKVQNKDGSWNGSDGKPYTFDTGQVLKGLHAIHPRMPEVGDTIVAGEQYLKRSILPDGRLRAPDESRWSDRMTNAIQIYATNDPQVWNYHRRHLIKPTLSHFAMYVAEALADRGEHPPECAWWPIEANGMVPGVINERWSCLPGQFQYAVVQFKLGNYINGTKAFKYGLQFQNASGGFYGCNGSGDYFCDEEISWAAKFFLDAYLWWMKSQFHRHARPELSSTDGRLVALRSAMPKPCGSVLDVGCGTGRYLLQVDAEKRAGLELSPQLVKTTPHSVEGSMLNIPFSDNTFDCTYAVESLEHSINPPRAISEMCRVTKPGGTVIIIDKNTEHAGEMELAPWEQWFNVEYVCHWLQQFCSAVTFQHVGWEDHKPTGLFVLWSGVKQ
jgi:malonyl-CoA O-methyltransferase